MKTDGSDDATPTAVAPNGGPTRGATRTRERSKAKNRVRKSRGRVAGTEAPKPKTGGASRLPSPLGSEGATHPARHTGAKRREAMHGPGSCTLFWDGLSRSIRCRTKFRDQVWVSVAAEARYC